MRPDFRYAYLHGFGSSADSFKGRALRERFAKVGTELLLPDLNRPSFATLDVRAMLAALDALDGEGPRWRLIGSSLGGWLAARWAMLHPERVDRLLLLCPGFNLAERWPQILGPSAFESWRVSGFFPFPQGAPDAPPVPVHFGFYESCRAEVGTPEVFCPTVIVHGLRDEVVPFESSRHYAQTRTHVDLVAVDDDHGLARSLDTIESTARRLFA